MDINILNNYDNEVIKKFISIYKKDSNITDFDYSTTIFNTYKNYEETIMILKNKVIGELKKPMIDTPLVFLKPNDQQISFSKKNSGIGFGFLFLNYTSNFPLLCVVIDKIDGDYLYKSVIFNLENRNFDESLNSSTNVNDINDLSSFVVDNLKTDVNKFIK